MKALYLDDFSVGQRFRSDALTVSADDIKRFAAEFDPQPFHLDEEAARTTLFGGLAASGWHTTALTMKLLVPSEFRPANGIIGVGFDEIKWPRPLRPGDTIHLEIEILDVRISRSNPRQGIVKSRTLTVNQHGEPVQIAVGNVVVPKR